MPRTVEGIVQAHDIATQRRRRGRPIWDGTLEFMTPMNKLHDRFENGDETLTAQELLDGFHAAAKEVRAKVPQAQVECFPMEHEDLEYFVATLEEMNVSFVENCPDIFGVFNNALDRLYDWCDVNRWWIKPAE